MNCVDHFGLVIQMVYDVYMQVANIRSRYDDFDNNNMYEGESPNAEIRKFYDMFASAN